MAENFLSESQRRKMNHQKIMWRLRNMRQHLTRNQLNHAQPPQNPFQRVVSEGCPEPHSPSLLHMSLQNQDGERSADGDLGIKQQQGGSVACNRRMQTTSNDAPAAWLSHSYTTHTHGSTEPAHLGEGTTPPRTNPREQESPNIPDTPWDSNLGELSFTFQRKLNSQVQLFSQAIQHTITEHQVAVHQLFEPAVPVPGHIDFQAQTITDGRLKTNSSDSIKTKGEPISKENQYFDSFHLNGLHPFYDEDIEVLAKFYFDEDKHRIELRNMENVRHGADVRAPTSDLMPNRLYTQ